MKGLPEVNDMYVALIDLFLNRISRPWKLSMLRIGHNIFLTGKTLNKTYYCLKRTVFHIFLLRFQFVSTHILEYGQVKCQLRTHFDYI